MNNQVPKISIIIPVYNVSPYIEECLESIARQDYLNYEMILVDDCGNDDSILKAQVFCDKHTEIKAKIVRHRMNMGLSVARNTGMDIASGEYILFVDSDDMLAPGALRNLVEPVKSKDYDVVAGKVSWSNPHSQGEKTQPLESYVKDEWSVMAWNNLYRSSFLRDNDIKFEPALIHEDIPWTFQIASLAKSLYIISDVTYIYRNRENSIITSMNVEKDLTTMIEAFRVVRKFILANNREFDHNTYIYVEGKKNAMLYSLLEGGYMDLYDKYYLYFHDLRHITPISALLRGVVSFSVFLRDLNYQMPPFIGKLYKKLFYVLFYKIRSKKIKSAIWQ